MSALGPQARSEGRPAISCVKCGSCFSACRRGAIGYSSRASARGLGLLAEGSARLRRRGGALASAGAFGLDMLRQALSPALLFPFTALSFGMIISTGFSAETMTRLVSFVLGHGFAAGGLR